MDPRGIDVYKRRRLIGLSPGGSSFEDYCSVLCPATCAVRVEDCKALPCPGAPTHIVKSYTCILYSTGIDITCIAPTTATWVNFVRVPPRLTSTWHQDLSVKIMILFSKDTLPHYLFSGAVEAKPRTHATVRIPGTETTERGLACIQSVAKFGAATLAGPLVLLAFI